MDGEKVIKGLGCCKSRHINLCNECPYFGSYTNPDDEDDDTCTYDLIDDALALLKEQEEEIENLKQTAQSMMEGICLLKEQEAKRVIRKQCKKEHDDGSIDYFAEWYCPHCNSLILRGFDNPSIWFCYKCGKPIKWEGR